MLVHHRQDEFGVFLYVLQVALQHVVAVVGNLHLGLRVDYVVVLALRDDPSQVELVTVAILVQHRSFPVVVIVCNFDVQPLQPDCPLGLIHHLTYESM